MHGLCRVTHLLANIVIAEEKARAEIFLRDQVAVDEDELANPGQDDVLDRLRRDAPQADHQDGRVAHSGER